VSNKPRIFKSRRAQIKIQRIRWFRHWVCKRWKKWYVTSNGEAQGRDTRPTNVIVDGWRAVNKPKHGAGLTTSQHCFGRLFFTIYAYAFPDFPKTILDNIDYPRFLFKLFFHITRHIPSRYAVSLFDPKEVFQSEISTCIFSGKMRP